MRTGILITIIKSLLKLVKKIGQSTKRLPGIIYININYKYIYTSDFNQIYQVQYKPFY